MWCLHSAAWWRRHWERTGIVDIEMADTHARRLASGGSDWHRAIAPDNAAEIAALEADRGRYLGYVRVVGRRTDKELSPHRRVGALRIQASATPQRRVIVHRAAHPSSLAGRGRIRGTALADSVRRRRRPERDRTGRRPGLHTVARQSR